MYLRLSKEDGTGESASIANQRKIILDEIRSKFPQGNYVIVDEYIDDGRSGVNEESRENFMRMSFDCKEGKVDCVIVKTLHRLFRNYSDQGFFLEEFIVRHGIRFITATDLIMDSYDAPGSTDSLDVPISGLMNDRFCKTTSDNIRKTFDTKRKNGEFIGAFCPFGYQKDPGNKNALIVDEGAEMVVRDIFHWFVNDGMSKTGIAKKLTAMGVPNPTEYKRRNGLNYRMPNSRKNDGLWCPKTISQMLSNRVYIGDMVQGKQRVLSYKVKKRVSIPPEEWFLVPDTHEAIIDKALFQQAQELLRRDTRTAPRSNEVHLFSGFIRCAVCGKAMRRNVSKGKAYYRCRTSSDKGKCQSRQTREDAVVRAVLDAIKTQISVLGEPERSIEEIGLQQTVPAQSVRFKNLLESNEKKLDGTRRILSSLYKDWKLGAITKDEYQRMKVEYADDAIKLEQAIAHIQKEMELAEKQIGITGPSFLHFQKHKNISELDRMVLVDLVDAVFVTANKQIVVDFSFADEYKRIFGSGDSGHKEPAPAENKAG